MLALLQKVAEPLDLTGIAPIASLGVGGAIAAMMFYFYRQDRKESEKRLAERDEACERRYAAIAEDYKTTLVENTAAFTRLGDAIDRMDQDHRR